MSNGLIKPVIFISYSHKDEPDKPGRDDPAWLTFVQSFLAPVVKAGVFDIWVDQHLHGGDALDPEIKAKLKGCDIFVLLTSRHSLASTYVIETEIATMRQRQKNGEDVYIFPIVLSPVPNAALKQLKDLVLKPKDGQPLSLMLKNDREVAMAGIADDIAAVAEKLAEKKASQTKKRVRARVRDSAEHVLELLGRHAQVDISHLPETAYERLVGREAELKRLDEAWADSTTNIISLIAEGGAGKSALVNEWLKRLQADNYRGAEAVLGWSFYSQGTKERATSADEFLNWALAKLGITLATTSASAKAEAIAEAMMRRRVLLLLDGVEPLQHGPGPQLGQLKDLGLRALLRRFAATPPAAAHGLLVLTSRLAVKDIGRWQDGAAPVENVERLSDEAGAALLRDNGVWGTDKELKVAAHDFGGHPLALGLLASFLKETQTGDVRRRDRIRAYFADADNPRHDHARRVMESYEKEWLVGHPVLLAIMHMVGLFDRPASRKILFALRKPPVITGLTDSLVNLDDKKWLRAIARLREVRLLVPPDPAAPDSLDAHPLVREWFGERLNETNEAAWKAAHGRLYEHLRDTTKEGRAPTLEDLAPLYEAIVHGCRAGRHRETLDDVYINRTCRRDDDQKIEYYSAHKLGAYGTNLVALSYFFDRPYDSPSRNLSAKQQVWITAQVGAFLGSLGRITEALQTTSAAIQERNSTLLGPRAAVQQLLNLALVQLSVGDINGAVESGKEALSSINKMRNEDEDTLDVRVSNLSNLAHALLCAGRSDEAEAKFREAELTEQRLFSDKLPLMRAGGTWYSRLFLERGSWDVVIDRATIALATSAERGWVSLIALDTLNLARAHLGRAFSAGKNCANGDSARKDAQHAAVKLYEASNQLQVVGEISDAPLSHLARAAFRRSVGDWDGAARDLDEVEEIAEPGPMRLFLCDMALERARLAFAKIEAFAPLNGLLDDSPPKPERPSEAECKSLHDEAAEQLRIAADYITTCGYHRRDEELAELQAVLRGERTFASLPPRV